MENTPMFKQCCQNLYQLEVKKTKKHVNINIRDDYDGYMVALFIDEIKQMQQRHSFKFLYIENNQDIQSFSFVNNLDIDLLRLRDCPNIEFKTTPFNITQLSVAFCNLQNISGIQKMVQLKKLDLNFNKIKNIQSIGSLINLTGRVGFGCSWIQATATPGSTGPARRLRLALPGLATLDVQGLAAPPKIDTPEGPLDLFLPARRLNIEVVNLIKKGCEQKYEQIYSQMRQQVKIPKSNLGSKCTQAQIFIQQNQKFVPMVQKIFQLLNIQQT
ncbi:Leucine-rich_repeat domain superfamily [Hexamita inflata]|uniref:Leucine-rich repeat domain superfamily n=1 Tax=Hexamita inflata TaxID=28002 RepID=A0AA86Q5Y4_9EUKA|nr:Leucine-rich repeat domain superfamily [Hexamita inflata]